MASKLCPQDGRCRMKSSTIGHQATRKSVESPMPDIIPGVLSEKLGGGCKVRLSIPLPYLWPKSAISRTLFISKIFDTLFIMPVEASTVALNIIYVLINNDEKEVFSKTWHPIQTLVQKAMLCGCSKGPKRVKSHTLLDCIYLYSPNKEVSPPFPLPLGRTQ